MLTLRRSSGRMALANGFRGLMPDLPGRESLDVTSDIIDIGHAGGSVRIGREAALPLGRFGVVGDQPIVTHDLTQVTTIQPVHFITVEVPDVLTGVGP